MGNKFHPSNLLYGGEARDFRHAMELVKQQCDHEIETSCRFNNPAFSKDEIDNAIRLEKSLDEMRRASLACLAEHAAIVSTIEKTLMEKWSKSPDEFVRMIGEAGLSGDYSGLAI